MSRVEICGGIASGKTTLASLLEASGSTATFEDFRQNPFWALFYDDPREHAFAAEVTFLLQHYTQVKVNQALAQPLACDFAFIQDRAYADINLSGMRRSAFQAVYDSVTQELAPASLVVHLECTDTEQLSRIRRRNRSEENSITRSYLEALNSAIGRHVTEIANHVTVLQIDSVATNFAADPGAQARVVQQVLEALAGQPITGC